MRDQDGHHADQAGTETPKLIVTALGRNTEQGTIAQITGIWERAGLTRPWNDPTEDIAFALNSPNATILIAQWPDETPILATAMTGHDGHRGAVYYLAVDPAHQGQGLGRIMMQAVEVWLKNAGVWKLNLMVREDNVAVTRFYEHLGYEVEPRTVLAKRLTAE